MSSPYRFVAAQSWRMHFWKRWVCVYPEEKRSWELAEEEGSNSHFLHWTERRPHYWGRWVKFHIELSEQRLTVFKKCWLNILNYNPAEKVLLFYSERLLIKWIKDIPQGLMSGFENMIFNLNYLQAIWIIWLSCPKVAFSLGDKRRGWLSTTHRKSSFQTPSLCEYSLKLTLDLFCL